FSLAAVAEGRVVDADTWHTLPAIKKPRSGSLQGRDAFQNGSLFAPALLELTADDDLNPAHSLRHGNHDRSHARHRYQHARKPRAQGETLFQSREASPGCQLSP